MRHRVLVADGEPDADLATDLERQAALDASRGEHAAAADHLRQALVLTPPGGSVPRACWPWSRPS